MVDKLKISETPAKLWAERTFGSDDVELKSASICTGPDTILMPLHIASFMHRSRWANTGVPPTDIMIQVQTRLMLHNAKKAYVGVLVDKTVHIYEVAGNEELQATIKNAVETFAEQVRNQTPPAIDETPAQPAADEKKLDGESTEDLARAWLAARQEKANASTLLKIADSRLGSYAAALLKRLKPGESMTVDKTRIIHNAKSGDLKTESSDDSYF